SREIGAGDFLTPSAVDVLAGDVLIEEKDMARKHTNHSPKGATNERKPLQYADQSVINGTGGEMHQNADGGTPGLTTKQVIPVADDHNSLKIGARCLTAL